MSHQVNISVDLHQVLQVVANAASRSAASYDLLTRFTAMVLYPNTAVPTEEVIHRLDALLASVETTNRHIGDIMPTMQELTTVVERLEAGTTSAANVLRELRDEFERHKEDAGVSADVERYFVGRLNAVADALEAMGKDVNNPVPVDPAEPTEPEEPTEPTEPVE